MVRFFVLVIFLIFQQGLSVPNKGLEIVGGETADIKDLPYQAALLKDGAMQCGANIVGSDILLTAAHCVDDISNITQCSVRVGSSQWDQGGQLINVTDVIINDGWYSDESLSYDIAVVKLAENITAEYAIPIPLAEEGHFYPAGTNGTVSGWGLIKETSAELPETLRKVVVPVYDWDKCAKMGNISKVICAGFEQGGKDSCTGDSGGPFAIDGVLVGIVSYGNGCAKPESPGVYQSIVGHRSWIKEHSGL